MPSITRNTLLKLSTRQGDFVKHWLANGGNATAAVIAAGYSESSASQTGSKLLKQPHIKAEIIARQERERMKEEMAVHVDRQWVINNAVKVVERCMGDEAYPFNATGAIKGLELLGKLENLIDSRDAKGQRSIQVEIKNFITEAGGGRTMSLVEGDARIEVSAGEILPPEPKTLGKPPIPEDMGEIVDAVTIELPDAAD